ncbi:MAG: 3-oxoacyl-[acyl-carrier protein] reductase [Acidimicrobiaceae bacterium]|nr:3-oxoacyl-[acyl-carrier protein] reductase [Acidimicrobiaceae bacterium]
MNAEEVRRCSQRCGDRDAAGDENLVEALFQGKRAIVTGGGGGIGSAIVADLHASGVSVAAIGRSASVHDVVAALPANGASSVSVQADLSDRTACEDAFGRALDQLGGLDILVTSHGHVRPQPSSTVDEQDWDLTLATNLTSVFQLSQLSFTVMEP